jgi:thymidylate synthase ThyX
MFTFAQESMRFAVVEDLAERVALPPSVSQHDDRGVEVVWRHAVQDLSQAYTVLVNNGVPAEDARGLLPHATQTRIMVRCDYRNLLKTAGDRLCTQAQFVWRNVFAQMMDRIKNYPYYNPMVVRELDEPSGKWLEHPVGELLVDGVFAPVCYGLGHCPFTADFDRRCTIRERVQRGAFHEINPAEWLLDPTAARRTT